MNVTFFAALVVRFLAKRFLPQYDGETDQTYNRAVNIEEKMLDLKIIDKTGKVGDVMRLLCICRVIFQCEVITEYILEYIICSDQLYCCKS